MFSLQSMSPLQISQAHLLAEAVTRAEVQAAEADQVQEEAEAFDVLTQTKLLIINIFCF